MTVQIGDTVKRRPLTFSKSIDAETRKPLLEGRVVYVHPKGRFHVVEFPIARRGAAPGLTAGVRGQRRGTRESFFGVEK